MSGIEKEFNALAAEYETNRLSPWYKAHAEAIIRTCPTVIEGDVLDVGCGTGYLLRRLLEKHPGARGVGLDMAGGMVAEARRLADAEQVDNAVFLEADWERFDTARLSGYTFGVAVCANAFHYFSNPEAAAIRLFEVLSNGGTLYVMERNKTASPMTSAWGWLHRHVFEDDVRFYTLDELRSFFATAGFSDVRVARSIERVLWMNKLYTSIVLLECSKG